MYIEKRSPIAPVGFLTCQNVYPDVVETNVKSLILCDKNRTPGRFFLENVKVITI